MKTILSIIMSLIVLLGAMFFSPDKDLPDVENPSISTTQSNEQPSGELSSPAEQETESDLPTTDDDVSQTTPTVTKPNPDNHDSGNISLLKIPAFSGKPFVIINGNEPYFKSSDYTTKSYEKYSPLDNLGRCGVTIACVGRDIMPTEERGNIGQVKPTGWHTIKYDIVDGKYLYNRCHLIGFQLTGENANTSNLITGTRYMNVEGMLPFENMVADYVKETNNHVLYRVTPIFKGSDLVARGVTIEAYSIEDNGEGICFNVYCYNNQPGIQIDYATGNSWLSDKVPATQEATTTPNENIRYILNTNSKKFHRPACSSAQKISDTNYAVSNDSRDKLINNGYSPCGSCKP